MGSGIVRKSAVDDVDRAGAVSEDCPAEAALGQSGQRGIVIEGGIGNLQIGAVCEYSATMNVGSVGKGQVLQGEDGALIVDDPPKPVAVDRNATGRRTDDGKEGVGS